jgi:hypothetical protein
VVIANNPTDDVIEESSSINDQSKIVLLEKTGAKNKSLQSIFVVGIFVVAGSAQHFEIER